MTIILKSADVRQLTDVRAMVEAVETALADPAASPEYQPDRTTISTPHNGFLRLMAAVVPALNVYGYKIFNAVDAHRVRYFVGLHDIDTGEQLLLADAAFLTAVRTGATAGVAARHCARDDASRVAVIGSGLEARTNLRAIAAVRDLTRVRVYSPNAANRAAMASEMADELDLPVIAAPSAAESAAGADIIIVATNTRGTNDRIAFRREWVPAGAHVSSIGSTQPDSREVDEAVLVEADHLIMDAPIQAASESGDVIAAVATGLDLDEVPSLDEVVTGKVPGRESPDELTAFKSVGSAVQDVAAAWALYQSAVEAGAGIHLDYLDTKIARK